MMQLIVAVVFLPLSHFGISSSRLRDLLVQSVGDRPYRALYSLLTLAAFAWLIVAYRRTPTFLLWVTPLTLKVLVFPLVLVGFLLAVVGVTTPNPTVVGAEQLFARPDIVRGIVRVTRNPFLWGVGLWALAHVVATGDVASVLFFGSIGALGLMGAPLLDAKKARRHGAQWQAFAAATSSVPFLAIVQGRQRLVLDEVGWWRVTLAVGLFLLMLGLHRWAFGVSPLPPM